MSLLTPSPAQAYAGLRAMKMIGEAEGPMGPAFRAMLEASQRNLLHTRFDLDALPPVSPDELGAALQDGALARQFVQAMCVLSAADGPPSERQSEFLAAFSQALGVEAPEVQVMAGLANHHSLMFRLDFYRRSHLRGMVEEQLRRCGLWGALRQLAAFRGVAEDAHLAARYRALGELPADTFGYAFFRHCVDHDFPFPGERHGFPEAGIYHDFSHVLSGYGVTPDEEMLIAAFIAGFRRENPSFVLLFAMLTFGAGINMAPVPQPQVRHILATPGLSDRFFRALERGSRLDRDLSAGWDHWELVALPLSEARRRLGVEPE